MNKRITTAVAALALIGAGLGVIKAEEAKEKDHKEITVQGEVLDMSCYMGHGASGAKHKQCALDCIKGGSPVGLLTKEGKVYLLVEAHDKKDGYASAKGLAGDQVTVSGDLLKRGGIEAIAVEKAVASKS